MGKDAGHLYIQGILGSLKDTIEIDDLFYYDPQTVNKNHYQITTGSASLTYSSNGLTVKGTTNTDTLVKNTVLVLPTNYTAELTITGLSNSQYNTYNYGGFCFDDCLMDLHKDYCKIYKLSDISITPIEITKVTVGDTVKIEMQNATMKIYVNGVLKHTRTVTHTGIFYYRTYNYRSLTTKNLLIHEL